MILQNLNDKNHWHFAIWQNWCFGQIYYSRIEVLENRGVLMVGGYSRELRDLFSKKIWVLESRVVGLSGERR